MRLAPLRYHGSSYYSYTSDGGARSTHSRIVSSRNGLFDHNTQPEQLLLPYACAASVYMSHTKFLAVLSITPPPHRHNPAFFFRLATAAASKGPEQSTLAHCPLLN
ncbi:unnamed protein product, partial [Ectocarpus sp. 6 AP-2014]